MHSAQKCKICSAACESERCYSCSERVNRADIFRRQHWIIPKRLFDSLKAAGPDFGVDVVIWPDEGALLTGPVGSGKTHTGHVLLLDAIRNDPRQTIAAYSWPLVLSKLRAGYRSSDPDVTAEGGGIVAALQDADVAMLDDLGAEKVTDANSGWIQEALYLILDHRWAWEKQTIVTTNLEPAAMADYLGPRIASRVLGMCRVLNLEGTDRRLGKK